MHTQEPLTVVIEAHTVRAKDAHTQTNANILTFKESHVVYTTPQRRDQCHDAEVLFLLAPRKLGLKLAWQVRKRLRQTTLIWWTIAALRRKRHISC